MTQWSSFAIRAILTLCEVLSLHNLPLNWIVLVFQTSWCYHNVTMDINSRFHSDFRDSPCLDGLDIWLVRLSRACGYLPPAFAHSSALEDPIITPYVTSVLLWHISMLSFTFLCSPSDTPGRHRPSFIAYVRVAVLIPSNYGIITPEFCACIMPAELIFSCCPISA